MKIDRYPQLLASLILMSLVGCAVNPGSPDVEERDSTPPPPVERDISEVEEADKPNTHSATAALLASAQRATNAQNYGGAIAYLERAVRLDPRNAELWLELSRAHLADGNHNAATQHARKAIALASTDEVATRDAWLQLADIKEAEGNVAEARAIRRRYRSISG